MPETRTVLLRLAPAVTGPLIAIDWGTTNRRCFLIEDGRVKATTRDERGALTIHGGDYEGDVAAIRARWGNAPVLIAGMAGSNRGWQEVAYIGCPAKAEDLADGIEWIEPRTVGIVPGVAQHHPRPDVMRGEEVQFLGAIAGGLAPDPGLLCQPGTHCKWAHVADGAIVGFSTAMTGELFALMHDHSLLAPQLQQAAVPGDAFLEGVKDARRFSLPVALFGVRAASLLGKRPDDDAASYTSGLLIGSDVAAQDVSGRAVHILSDGPLGDLYAAATTEFGGRPVIVDGSAAFTTGMSLLWEIANA